MFYRITLAEPQRHLFTKSNTEHIQIKENKEQRAISNNREQGVESYFREQRAMSNTLLSAICSLFWCQSPFWIFLSLLPT
jgi:hypothetical protein